MNHNLKFMPITTIEQLLTKPVAMMTGEELAALICHQQATPPAKAPTPMPEKHYEYGIKGIAHVFGCSLPTAQRIKKSGIIDPAITQVGRKIVVDSESALRLVKEAGMSNLINR